MSRRPTHYEHGEEDVNMYFNNEYDNGMTFAVNHNVAESLLNMPLVDDTQNDQCPLKRMS